MPDIHSQAVSQLVAVATAAAVAKGVAIGLLGFIACSCSWTNSDTDLATLWLYLVYWGGERRDGCMNIKMKKYQ